jgi:hypothetical protein|tara:strand:+ start:671 stop:895 length:225 start_codon:yes stop_codon:yes gene_type:complete
MKTLNRKQKRQAVKMEKKTARLNASRNTEEVAEFNLHLGSKMISVCPSRGLINLENKGRLHLLDEILERRRQTV